MAYSTALASAARAAGTASSNNLSVPLDAKIRAELVVTASNTPTTLNVKIEHSNDGGNTWIQLKAFTQVGAVSSSSESIEILAPTSGLVRATYTVVGTSYTFSVTLRWY